MTSYCPDMNNALDKPGSDRSSRTRSWIVAAFNRLVLGRRYDSLSVGDVSRRAGVGRSTFYEHFRDKDDVLRQALEPVFVHLADAAVGAGDVHRVRWVLDHIAENRARAKAMLDGPARGQIERALTELILARLAKPPSGDDGAMRGLNAARLAGSQVAVLRAWLEEGAAVCPSSRVAAMMVAATASVGGNQRL